VVKMHSKDPFKNTIAPSQFFQFDAKKDTVFQGKKGTLLVFQKGSFIDANENVVTKNIEIELAEALTLDDMLLSNLTTKSGDQLLETDGMIYFNATSEGEQLFVNPEKPVYIEIPSTDRKAGMSVYEGIRDENGNMNWINPIPVVNYLTAVDLFSLDFLPEGFAEAVEKEMPFRNYETANELLIDSLYYSLYFKTGNEIIEETLPDLNVKETYYGDETASELDSIWWSDVLEAPTYGVDPAAIKTIKNEKFQNTLIATKQFEERLKLIFKICRTDVIDIYTRNLDKNLWELDSIAASLLDENVYQEDFEKFAAQKWANIKEPNKNLKLLKGFYEKRIKAVQKELTDQRNKAVKAFNEKTKAARIVVENYKKLLKKREAYRMTGYGFEMTEMGWINIDIGVEPKDWDYAPLEFVVTNTDKFDRVYGYVLYTSIKSLYSLNSTDSKTFYVGNENQREMIMPKKEKAVAVVIGYQGQQAFSEIIEFETNLKSELKFDLKKTSDEAIKKALLRFESYKKENSILEDLRYVDQLFMEKIRQDKKEHEDIVMALLKGVSSPVDSSYMYFNRAFQIDMPVDTCLNKIRGSKPWSSPE
ncbi:MAG: hypothetical protein AB8B59_03315, partial [Maribacter sp.]